MFDKTITLFCNEGNGTYRPHVLEGVFVSKDKGYLMRNYGAEYSDGAAVNVQLSKNGETYFCGSKQYLNKKAYESLTDTAKAGAITFRGGNLFDFVWVGDYRTIDSHLAPIPDGSGFFQTFKKAHDDVFAVQTVAGPYAVIPHIEVTLK